ncbi:Probable proline rich signal peptide protein precursor [hydrothermal vent metagenome]|uniref:Probable proline rich signal peptide protein n=1 Tax=hydrothermal vent metagenome TaxID=652676 RepID=A0A3B1B9A9_9ZZZZ
MPVYARYNTIFTETANAAKVAQTRLQQCLALLYLLLLLVPAPSQAAEAFLIKSLETQLHDEVYLFNAHIKYGFSEEALAALKNGVPLIILMNIEVQEKRWYWNKTIAQLEQGYLLIYHALSKKFILHNLNSGIQNDYSNLDDALFALGHLRNMPLIDAKLLKPDSHYILRLRSRLDIESLPAPMRPLAYISSDWRLQSDWYTWPLTP